MMHDGATRRGSRLVRVLSIALLVALVAALVWGSDRITMQGERTIYTVDCDGGTWTGRVCSGKLAPSKRYAFRASLARQEVIYWIRGSMAPSGKFPECNVVDRDNWSCKAAPEGSPATIAYEMAKGHPTRAGSEHMLPYHSVQKWKWWLIDAGLRVFTRAEN
jgi:hypothetical protein